MRFLIYSTPFDEISLLSYQDTNHFWRSPINHKKFVLLQILAIIGVPLLNFWL